METVYGDIVDQRVDALVNAANTQLLHGGGVCGAIFRAAGPADLAAACAPLAPISPGEAVITEAFNIPVQAIIHTAGPIWRGGDNGEEDLLRACYRNACQVAVDNDLHSVAFPLLSAGIYGYPPQAALEIATAELTAAEQRHSAHSLRTRLVLWRR